MKKTIIAIAAVTALAVTSYGQGYIYINNLSNTGGAGAQTDHPTYSSAVTANGLFYTADTAAQAQNNGDASYGTQIGVDFNFAIYAGTSSGSLTYLTGLTGGGIAGDNAQWGQVQGPSGSFAIGSGSPTTVYLEVFAWEGSATTWAGAVSQNAYRADSGVFANPAALTGAPVIPSITGMPDMLLNVSAVPEPSTLALAGLGGFGMLMALRRKKA